MTDLHHYFVVDLHHFSGGVSPSFFMQESAGRRRIAQLVAQAERQQAALLEHGFVATIESTVDSVEFSWDDGPMGFVRWSAKLTRIGTDDHLV